jgi:glutathione S-transferase
MTLKLYVFPPSPRAFKVLLAAHQFDLAYELCAVDLTKGGQRTPAFLALRFTVRRTNQSRRAAPRFR